jgi:Icc-related predicted phosphoesterase
MTISKNNIHSNNGQDNNVNASPIASTTSAFDALPPTKKDIKICYSADLHGSIPHYEKLVRFAEQQKADMILIGGDLMPKAQNIKDPSQPDKPHLKTVDYQRRFFEEEVAPILNSVDIPSWIILGNADFKCNIPYFKQLSKSNPGKHKFSFFEGDGELAVIPGTDLVMYTYSHCPLCNHRLKDWLRVDTNEMWEEFVQKKKLADPASIKLFDGIMSAPDGTTHNVGIDAHLVETNRYIDAIRMFETASGEKLSAEEFILSQGLLDQARTNPDLDAKENDRELLMAKVLKSFEYYTMENDLSVLLPLLFNKNQDILQGRRMLWCVHDPPFGGPLDMVQGGEHVGSKAIRDAIRKFSPFMSFHGHIHETVEQSGKFKYQIEGSNCWSMAPGEKHWLDPFSCIVVDTACPENAERFVI